MKIKEKQQAILLRQEGKSIKDIAKILKVAISTVSVWVRDISLSTEQQIYLNKKRFTKDCIQKRIDSFVNNKKQKRIKLQNIGRQHAYQSSLHIIGCMLYWGEGDKTSRYTTSIVNCDIYLLKKFLEFLIECYQVPKHKIRLRIDFYQDIKTEQEVIDFWLTNLQLNQNNLTTIKSHKPKTHCNIKQPYGVARISVDDVELKQKILGAIQEYGNFNSKQWLK